MDERDHKAMNEELREDERKVIKLIQGRINDEYYKHQGINWEQISATKIYRQWFKFYQDEIYQFKKQLKEKEEEIEALQGALKDCISEIYKYQKK